MPADPIAAALVLFFAFGYVAPALIVMFAKDRLPMPEADRGALFSVKERDRYIFAALFVGQTLALTYAWSASEIAVGMGAMEALEIVAGKATAAAPGALLSTFILTEGVYGIMIVFSYLYDKMKKEREEYYRHAGRSERDEEVAALKARAAERDEEVAALKARNAELQRNAERDQEIAALKAQVADGIARDAERIARDAERDEEFAALKAQMAELQRRRNGNADGSQNDESPTP